MRMLPVTAPGDPDTGSAARFLRWLGRQHAAALTAGTLWGCLWMGGMAVTPFAIGQAVDAMIAKDTSGLLRWSTAVFAIGLAVAAGSIMRHRCDTFVRLGSTYRAMQLVTRQATRLGAKLDKRVAAGEIVAVSTTDIQQVGYFIDALARGIASAISILGIAVLMLVTSLPVGLLVLIGVPLLLFGSGPLLRPLHKRAEQRRDHQADLTERAVDIVAGLRVLHGIGGEAEIAARYRRDSEKVRDAGINVARIESILNAAEVLLPGLLALGVVWLSAQLSIGGSLTPGELVTFYAYAAFLSLPMRMVTELANDSVGAHVAAGRVVRFLNVPHDDQDSGQRVTGSLVLSDPESGLMVRPGTLTAVATSTVEEGAALAARLGGYVPSDVTLGGVRLDELAPRHLRETILVSDNDSHLFSGVLATELAADDPQRTADALRITCAEHIIEALPDGLLSTITERGFSLSGGERQRLKLARAILAKPPVLVLVDPASSVDAHTEALIAQRLQPAGDGRTIVVISNSPLLLHQAQEVAFVSNGKVLATGTHRELMAGMPEYARTVLREES